MVGIHKNTYRSIAEVRESAGHHSIMDCTHPHATLLSWDYINSFVQECIKKNDPTAGRRAHDHIISNGLDSITIFNDHLIRLYASCNCLQEANAVFCKVSRPSVYTWTAIISAHVDLGEYARALELFERMQSGGPLQNKCLFLCILKVCCDESFSYWGEMAHDQVIRAGLESDVAIGSLLVSMYAKRGCLQEASRLFDHLLVRDTILWSALITGYCNNGQCRVALNLLEQMLTVGTNPDSVMFLCMLKSCSRTGALEEGQLIHSIVITYGLESDVALGSSLVDLYAKSEHLKEAYSTFDKLIHRNIVSWNSLIAGYAPHGFPAIELFDRMQEDGLQTDKVTFLSVLRACRSVGDAERGARIHGQVTQCGLESDVGITSTLIGMYAKCGRLLEADELFEKMLDRDVVAWGALIGGYTDAGQGFCALELFKTMQKQGIKPIKVTFLYALKACSSIENIEEGRLINDQIIRDGFELDDVIASSLVDMYAKCMNLTDARKVFDDLSRQDVVAWGTLISAYAQHGHGLIALELFQKMQQQGVRADKRIFLSIIRTCGTACTVVQGQIMHDLFIKSRFVVDMDIGNALVDMYAKCGFLNDAYKVFETLPNQDLLSWGVFIAACVDNGFTQLAFRSFRRMQELGLAPDNATIVCVLKACKGIEEIQQGRLVHEYVISGGGDSDTKIGNSLIAMYFACGSFREAHNVFDRLENPDGVSWGSMIVGYAQNGHGLSALEFFERMQEQGLVPDSSTFTCSLKACCVEGLSRQGRLLHDQIVRAQMDKELVVANVIIDMYSKCGFFCDANKTFHNMASRDDISWGAIISCNSLHGDGSNVLQLYARMQLDDIKPDFVTAACGIKACSSIGAVKLGRLIHDQVIRCGIETDLVVGTTIVDMYAKFCSPKEAQRAFDRMQYINEASWTALLSASIQDSSIEHVRGWVNDLKLQGFKPDSQTYTSFLSAWTRAGQSEEVGQCVVSMNDSNAIAPTIDHFNCVIDSLSRVGLLHEAEQVLLTMPTPPDITGWVSLLTACRTFGNTEVGSDCLNHVAKLDLSGTGGYVMVANMYAEAQKWLKVNNVLNIRKCVGAWKRPGQAWLELEQEIHGFTIGDHFSSHREVCSFKIVRKKMRKEGFVPQVDLVLEINSKDEVKANMLSSGTIRRPKEEIEALVLHNMRNEVENWIPHGFRRGDWVFMQPSCEGPNCVRRLESLMHQWKGRLLDFKQTKKEGLVATVQHVYMCNIGHLERRSLLTRGGRRTFSSLLEHSHKSKQTKQEP